jgi:EAL domain-containing protein (putative c-di-GMP-specific phosphodiesterase class I)
VLINEGEALRTLHQLRALGVRIALDDFGTGYSSLSYLRRFPFDKIKIDRSFVKEIDNPDTAAIVRAMVGLGSRLGIAITAEGIETQAQLDQVRAEGCTEAQGYLHQPPGPGPGGSCAAGAGSAGGVRGLGLQALPSPCGGETDARVARG